MRMERDIANQALVVSGSDGLFELGLQFSSGRAGGVDLVEAHKWFNLAAARGNRNAMHYRRELSMSMTKAEISKAQRLAREWLKGMH